MITILTYVFIGISLSVLGFASLFIFGNILTWIPYMPTPKSAIEAVLKEVKIKKQSKVYDLGAGDGRVLEALEKKWNIEGVGYELSLLPFLWSKWRLRNLKSKVYFRDFFKTSLKDADLVFCFLTKYVAPKLQEKFARELRAGTKIISYGVEIKGCKQVQIIPKDKDRGQISDIYIYQK